MDLERAKKRQSLKVIISEAIMVLTVIATVIILALLVSGYWLNSDFKVERQGMLQISSVPTGADVYIDGESSWLQRTNTSKVLTSGEHTVLLTREGYDTWSKTINITEGLLYRIHYPRLFLQNRVHETAYDAVGTTKVFIFSDRATMLLYSGDVATLDTSIYAELPIGATAEDLATILPEWTLLNLNSDQTEAKPVDRRTLYDYFKRPEPSPSKDTVADFAPDLKLTGDEQLIFSRFYEDRYLTILDGATVTVYQKDIPEPVLATALSFTPAKAAAGHNGEFNILYSGPRIATLDMESMSIKEWSVDGATFGWFNEDMFYSVKDGELFVYDFDGLNRRSLATNVSERFPVVVINDRYLYYFSDDNLVREWLVPR